MGQKLCNIYVYVLDIWPLTGPVSLWISKAGCTCVLRWTKNSGNVSWMVWVECWKDESPRRSWTSEKYITMEVFNPGAVSRAERERERDLMSHHSGCWPGVGGQTAPGWEVKPRYTRFANVESEYDPKRKFDSLTDTFVVNWPVPASWRQNKDVIKRIKCFKSALCQPRGCRAKK